MQEKLQRLIEQAISSQKELKGRLFRGEITNDQAAAIIFSKRTKPWHTKIGRSIRDMLIEDKCSQCGAIDHLVLQHTWQPAKFADIKREVRRQLRSVFDSEHPYPDEQPGLELQDRLCCPKCQSISIRFGKKRQAWLCSGTRRIRYRTIVCGHEFCEPSTVKALTPEQKREKANRNKEVRDHRWNQFLELYGDEILTKSLLISIDEHIRYMSYTDVITLCKRCAFAADVSKQQLCKVCGERYHDPVWSKCYVCHQLEVSRDNASSDS